MLVNDRLYKLVGDEILPFTTDDIPEGTLNKYGSGGMQQLIALLPWAPVLDTVYADKVTDGPTAYAVSTGSYLSYEVSDGAKVYHVVTDEYTSYEVTDGDKSYEVSTGDYSAYAVTDGDIVYEVSTGALSVFEVTNGPAAYEVQTENYTSYEVTDGTEIKYVAESADYTKLYNEKELLTEYTSAETFTYTGNTESIKLTGYSDSASLADGVLYNDVELTQAKIYGYKTKADYTLVTGEKINGVIAYTKNAGSVGTVADADVYADKELTQAISGVYKYNGITDPIEIKCYVGTEGNGAITTETIYRDYHLSEEYIAGGIPNTAFSYTGETALGHIYYVAVEGAGNLTDEEVYSDTLLREVVDVVKADFSWTGDKVMGNNQTFYTDGPDPLTANFYNEPEQITPVVVKGVKTKADFSLTGNEYFGNLGYVENSTFTTIYSDKLLREETDYDISLFHLTGNSEVVTQSGWSKDESITAVYTTNKTDVEYEIKGVITLEDFLRDGETAFGHIGYTATANAIDVIYTDTALITAADWNIADFSHTGISKSAPGQNAYVREEGTSGVYLTNQVMYSDSKLSEVFNPQGAKTTQSFYYTGITEFGHEGYVFGDGSTKSGPLPSDITVIYEDNLLLEPLTNINIGDFYYTSDIEECPRALSANIEVGGEDGTYTGDACATTDRFYVYTEVWVDGELQSNYWQEEELSETILYICDGRAYYYDGHELLELASNGADTATVNSLQELVNQQAEVIAALQETITKLEDRLAALETNS